MTDPVVDPDRLDRIAVYDLFSDGVRERLDALSAETARQLDVPAVMVSIVLDTAQYVAGSHGLEEWIVAAGGTPVEWSFCAVTVRSGGGYVVEDAAADALQQDNPLVTEGVIRSYAGMPLVTPDGHVIGAHCVLDNQPRRFDAEQLRRLEALSAEIMGELEIFHRLDVEETGPPDSRVD